METSITKLLKQYPRCYYLFFKRCFDILFSLSFVLLFTPFYILIALAIKCDSKGPIFYSGKRLGKGGKYIKVYKFRTMHTDAEERLAEVLANDPKSKKEWNIYQKLEQDPRCTRVGKWLRQTSLDEFPQFFCVLRGDLSVVGPRPHYICELENNPKSPLHSHVKTVLSVKPGITSIWQISGRNTLSYKDRVDLDCLYVQKQSFFYDLYLILKTIPALFSFKGAF